VLDLPGTYSLTAMSDDELVARGVVLNQTLDLIVSIVDSSNLERNLYLAVQYMDLAVPMVLVFNKMDIALQRGIAVNTPHLSALLGADIVPTVASDGKGIAALKATIVRAAAAGKKPAPVSYGPEIDAEIERLTPLVESVPGLAGNLPARWVALKLIENDAEVAARARGAGGAAAPLLAGTAAACRRIEKHFGDSPELVVAERRYGFISGACRECVSFAAEARHTRSDRVDEVLTSGVFGIPIFFALMYLLFKVTFTLAAPLSDLIETAMTGIGDLVVRFWPASAPDILRSLIVDGILAGVGGVLAFTPNIAVLFASIAILEESGYMARGAFLMDRFMHKVGLHGRSFIPMIVGFGCTVPAVMATRALGSRRARMATIMVLPLISCGARFPIYSMFTAALFPPHWRAQVMMSLYVIGIALAGLGARFLRSFVFTGETAPFVMELPPYRAPTFIAIARHTGERLRLFVRKAATVILAASAAIWALTSFPRPDPAAIEGLSPDKARQAELENSAAGRIGRAIEPAMRLAGFDWQASTALIGAFAAKEVFVAHLGILNAHEAADRGKEGLSARLREHYTPLQAYCIMLFCLISLPCVATFAVVRAESGGWKWAAAQALVLTLLAYAVSFVVYQTGLLLS
jgi:ferrous iron transport protein B